MLLPLRVAAALRMHNCIAFLLQQGCLDPDDRIQPLQHRQQSGLNCLGKRIYQSCQNDSEVCTRCIAWWKYSMHQLYHASVKNAVFAVLVVTDRLAAGRAVNTSADVPAGPCSTRTAPARYVVAHYVLFSTILLGS